MAKLKDVGTTGKTKEEIKALRKVAFKRPKLIKDRQALRKERIDEARGYTSDDTSIREQDKG